MDILLAYSHPIQIYFILLEIFELCNVLLHEKDPQYLKALSIFELFSKLLQNV